MSEENKTNLTKEQSESIPTEDKMKTAKESETTEKTDQTAKSGQKKAKTKREKKDEALRGLSMKERRKVEDEWKEKRRKKWYVAIGVIVMLLVAGLLFFDSGYLQRHMTALKVGEETYSVADLDYYYYTSYNNYSSYASYYGLDTSKSLKDQQIYSGTSWYDYFRDNAKKTLTNVAVLVQEAQKADYSLSKDGQKTVDKNLQTLNDTCKKQGYTVAYYLNVSYGQYMDYNTYKKLITDGQLAQEYEAKMKKSYNQTDKDVNQYYKQHKAQLDTFNYEAYLVPVSTGADANSTGNAKAATAQETAAAKATAKKGAEELKQAMADNDKAKIKKLVKTYSATDYSNQTYSNFSGYDFSAWLTNEKRKAGDVTSVKYETKDSSETATLNGYYVVRFEKRYLDQYRDATFRNILIKAAAEKTDSDQAKANSDENATYDYDTAKGKAEKLEAKWEKNGGDSNAFAALTKDNSGDTTSSDKGGLYENASKTDVSDALKAWLFDKTRKKGDHAILKDEKNQGYQLVYFESYSEKHHWQNVCISALQDADYNNWYDGVAKDYKDSITMMYRYV